MLQQILDTDWMQNVNLEFQIFIFCKSLQFVHSVGFNISLYWIPLN